MRRLLSLTAAMLKQFLRDKRAISLLFIFPLLLISAVFVSFNSDGLRTVPAGFIIETPQFASDAYAKTFFPYLDITYYGLMEQCIHDLKRYQQYACVKVTGDESLHFSIQYDNTREPVIWEVLERLQRSFDTLEQQASLDITSGVLSTFGSQASQVADFESLLRTTRSDIDNSVGEISEGIRELEASRARMAGNLDSMDADIDDAQEDVGDARREKDNAYSEISGAISEAEYLLRVASSQSPDNPAIVEADAAVQETRDELDSYEREAERELDELDNKLLNYERMSAQGRQELRRLDQGVDRLADARRGLRDYRTAIDERIVTLDTMHASLQELARSDPESIINPFETTTEPVYGDSGSTELISLHTLFPAILLLLVVFLSLLVSSYAALNYINSNAYIRLRVSGVQVIELLAVYIASLTLLVVPILVVLLIGQLLFGLPILANGLMVLFVLYLLASAFTLLGMLLAYAIRHESITLVLITFLFVLLTFFSGFLFPIERMSPIAALVAYLLPVKMALSAFSRVVFYGSSVLVPVIALMIWNALLAAGLSIAAYVKKA